MSRKVAKHWVAHLDVPALPLHATFRAMIQSRTLHLLQDETPDKSQMLPWDADFVRNFGTHDAHSITHGVLDLALTWFSLKAEQSASKQGIELTAAASATLDTLQFGDKTTLSQEWSQKHGLEVSVDDTLHLTIGTPDPVGIFLDLRPLTELMSPIFVPYDADDAWGRFAPWVWYDLRNSFDAHLLSKGLGKGLEPDLLETYTPHRFVVTFPSISVSGSAPKQMGETPSNILKATGSVTISEAKPVAHGATPPSGVPDPSQSLIIDARSLTLSDALALQPGAYQPDRNTLSCTIATPGGNINAGALGGLCLDLAIDLQVTEDVDVYTYIGVGGMGGSNTKVTYPRAHFQASGLRVNLPFASLPRDQAQVPTATVSLQSGPYTLHMSVAATDAGLFV